MYGGVLAFTGRYIDLCSLLLYQYTISISPPPHLLPTQITPRQVLKLIKDRLHTTPRAANIS